jgi:putative DNA primase/helicase
MNNTNAQTEAIYQILNKYPVKYDKETGKPIGGRAKVKPTLDNLRSILHNDDQFREKIVYNEMTDQVLVSDRPLEAHIITELKFYMRDVYNMRTSKSDNLVSTDILREAIVWFAYNNRINPLVSYLDSLPVYTAKDSILETFFEKYMGVKVEDNYIPLIRAISYKWFLSCVARAYEEGAKVDTVLILQGRQGEGKGQALETLAGEEFFADSDIPLSHKDGKELIHQTGAWIWELAEMASLRRQDSETIKQYITSRFDRYRPSYGKDPIRRGRRVVFTATTNKDTFLTDATGNRRFWILTVKDIKLDAIRRDRDLIWSEAVTRYKRRNLTRETWYLDRDLEDLNKEYQESYVVADPWVETCRSMLTINGVTLDDILTELEIPVKDRRMSHTMKITDILTQLGAIKSRQRRGSRRVTIYSKKEDK